MQAKIAHATQVIRAVAQKSDRAILFFSGGKDSLALLDLMAPHFKEVVLVFMYFVPGLEHINRYLRFAQARYPNTSLVHVPHWGLSRIRKYGIYCKPDPTARIVRMAEIDAAMRERTGIEVTFYGFKKSDTLARRLMLMGYELEAISSTGKVYPLSHWLQGEVAIYNKSRGIPAAVDYDLKKKSAGLGFDPQIFRWLQSHHPNDLRKILAAYPTAERLLHLPDPQPKTKKPITADV